MDKRTLISTTRTTATTAVVLLCFGLRLLFAVNLSAQLIGIYSPAPLLGSKLRSTTAAVHAQSQWHAPIQSDINNLTAALQNDGVYGFIYNSSDTPDHQYGTYNWCNMPHVRAQEYIKLGSESELQYVEVVSLAPGL